jgi:hypothetical protein
MTNIHNIEDYKDDTLPKKEQVDIIINAIGLISDQLASAKQTNDYQAIQSNRVAMYEFIKEWQDIKHREDV